MCGEHGGKGGLELAKTLIRTLENKKSDFKLLYDEQSSIKIKFKPLRPIYMEQAKLHIVQEQINRIRKIEKMGLAKLPVCIAKLNILSRMTPKTWTSL